MASEIKSVNYFNPNDPSGSKNLAQQMMAAQLQEQIAQQQMQEGSQQPQGQYIPGNSLAPGREVRVNPMANLAAALTQVTGAYGQKAAMSKQIDLQQAMMQRQYAAMSGLGGGQQDPQQAAIGKAMQASMMGAPDSVVKGIMEYGTPTPEQKNFGAGLAPANTMTFGDQSTGAQPTPQVSPMPPQVPNGAPVPPVPPASQGTPVPQPPLSPGAMNMDTGGTGNPVQDSMNAVARQQAITGVSPGQNEAYSKLVQNVNGSPSQLPPSLQQAANAAVNPPTAPPSSTLMAYKDGKPLTDGLEAGRVWAKDANGQMVQQAIPNITAKKTLDDQLQYIHDQLDKLNTQGGAVNQGGNVLSNLKNMVAGGSIKIPFTDDEISGNTIPTMMGTDAATTRENIDAAIKQTVPVYMAAMGITPGMERAVSAQKMLADALGGSTSMPIQNTQEQLRRISKEAGLGSVGSAQQGDTPITKTLNGVTYTKINGQWHQ